MPPGTWFTSHVTVALELPVTMAWNCCVAPSSKLALVGATVTLTFDGTTFEGLPAIPQLISVIMATHKTPRAAARNQLCLP